MALLLALTAGVAAWEFFRIARAAGYEPIALLGVPLAAALPLLVHGYRLGFNPPVLTMLTIVALIIFATTVGARGVAGHAIGATAVTILGIVYCGAAVSFAYGLRYQDYVVGAAAGCTFLLYPLVLTWTSDTGAYFVGRAIGRHRLIPSVSPGKTVEGALGALVLTALASWLYARFLLVPLASLALRPAMAVLIGVILSIVVQLGDLAESLIKREAGVKDSSHLLPGHGGVLDRIDGLLFALPAAYLIFTFPHVLVPVVR